MYDIGLQLLGVRDDS